MPSMEVYSGVPSEPTMHFEDWMQTQYSGLKSKLSKWANLSDEQKAELFLGQLNSYFEHRNKLLGDDDYYLFPRDRPSKEVLKVSQCGTAQRLLLEAEPASSMCECSCMISNGDLPGFV